MSQNQQITEDGVAAVQGQRKTEGSKEYIRLYNNTGGALTKNTIYTRWLDGADTDGNYEQVIAYASAGSTYWEICVATTALADATWGWFQTKGQTSVVLPSETHTAGEVLVLGTGSVPLTTTATATVTDIQFGNVVTTTSASATTAVCYLHGSRYVLGVA